MKCQVLIVFLFDFGTCTWFIPSEDASDGLVLLHVLHRHGARTRDDPTYPNDPYYNYTYWPYGIGQLTDEGKRKEYELGKTLRRRYSAFLGDVYYPSLLDARSTDFDRTKMSLQLSLAGLFPPRREHAWSEEIPWQPIPYSYEKEKDDYVLGIPFLHCSKARTLFGEYLKGDALKVFEDDVPLYTYLSEHTGWNFTSPMNAFFLYNILLSQEHLGLRLPSWTEPIWKEPLKDAAAKFLQIMVGTKELARLGGGFFLKKVLDDTINKINGTLLPQDRKLFLYSAHDFSIAFLLSALNIYDNKIPSFSSYVTIEVRFIDGVYGVQILYQNYEGDEPLLLTVPGCEPFCPLDQFIEIISDIIPQSEEECNQ